MQYGKFLSARFSINGFVMMWVKFLCNFFDVARCRELDGDWDRAFAFLRRNAGRHWLSNIMGIYIVAIIMCIRKYRLGECDESDAGGDGAVAEAG